MARKWRIPDGLATCAAVTFLLLAKQNNLTARQVARQTGFSTSATRASLALLVSLGYVTRRRNGLNGYEYLMVDEWWTWARGWESPVDEPSGRLNKGEP